jgi:protein phosphatase
LSEPIFSNFIAQATPDNDEALVELVKERLRMLGDAGFDKDQSWKPAFEESSGRKLSAPSHWLCAITDIGRRRRNNEDGYFLSADCRLWIVADGVGGHAAGEIASALTIQAIADSFTTSSAGTYEVAEADAGARLAAAFADAQERVSGRSLTDHECHGMGSTAIAAFVTGEALHLCHVGDTRGYHFSEGQFRRLTNDHSLVWELVMSGLLTADQARLHPQRSTITQAIGMVTGVQPAVTTLLLKPRDRILLCSDGLWEALAEHDIARIVGSGGSMLDLASSLVDKAKAESGQDNITAVLYEHASHAKPAF